jgi:hypothetical protein
MKSKNPPGRRVPRAKHGAAPKHHAAPDHNREAVILDFIQSRIEAFNQDHGGGVFVRKVT